VVQAYDVVRVGYWDWYLIAPNQWVEQRDLSLAEPQNKPPGGIKGKWVEINLYEQVLVAYQDSQPVFATLISSGLQQFATEPGLFSIYVKVPNTRMSGAYTATQSDYYDIEDVPWTMYFDGDRGIHGAYWHDYFGYRRSHGCINLSLTDAKWLYEWAARGC
jgi:lipoprotein-anchoring transpeptidase ErfK/SrfK